MKMNINIFKMIDRLDWNSMKALLQNLMLQKISQVSSHEVVFIPKQAWKLMFQNFAYFYIILGLRVLFNSSFVCYFDLFHYLNNCVCLINIKIINIYSLLKPEISLHLSCNFNICEIMTSFMTSFHSCVNCSWLLDKHQKPKASLYPPRARIWF